MRSLLLVAAAATVACGPSQPATRKTISAEDTAAALGHMQVDSAALAANKASRRTITQAQIDSQNAMIRERNRGTRIPTTKRSPR